MTPAQQINAAHDYGYQNMWQFNLSPIGLYAQTEIAKICTSMIGLNNLENSVGLTIYPNPATNQITIQSDSKINNVHIYDFMGKIVMYSDNLQSETLLLPDNLKTGIYILKIQTESGDTKHKLLIDK